MLSRIKHFSRKKGEKKWEFNNDDEGTVANSGGLSRAPSVFLVFFYPY